MLQLPHEHICVVTPNSKEENYEVRSLNRSTDAFIGRILFWLALSNQAWWADVIGSRPNICFRNGQLGGGYIFKKLFKG